MCLWGVLGDSLWRRILGVCLQALEGGKEGELRLQGVCSWGETWRAVQLLRPDRNCQRGSKLGKILIQLSLKSLKNIGSKNELETIYHLILPGY